MNLRKVFKWLRKKFPGKNRHSAIDHRQYNANLLREHKQFVENLCDTETELLKSELLYKKLSEDKKNLVVGLNRLQEEIFKIRFEHRQCSMEKELRIKDLENDHNEIRHVFCQLKLENKKMKAEKKVMANDIEKLSDLVKYHIIPARKCKIISHRKYEHIERILDSYKSENDDHVDVEDEASVCRARITERKIPTGSQQTQSSPSVSPLMSPRFFDDVNEPSVTSGLSVASPLVGNDCYIACPTHPIPLDVANMLRRTIGLPDLKSI